MDKGIKQRLKDACIGQPAKIAWPHRLLHDAEAHIAELEAERDDFAARCAVLAGALEKAAPKVCDFCCPAVWRGDQPHSDVCKEICQALADLPEAAREIVEVMEALRGNTEFEPWWERYGGMLRAAHYINVWVRVGGEDKEFEADWLRDTAKALEG